MIVLNLLKSPPKDWVKQGEIYTDIDGNSHFVCTECLKKNTHFKDAFTASDAFSFWQHVQTVHMSSENKPAHSESKPIEEKECKPDLGQHSKDWIAQCAKSIPTEIIDITEDSEDEHNVDNSNAYQNEKPDDEMIDIQASNDVIIIDDDDDEENKEHSNNTNEQIPAASAAFDDVEQDAEKQSRIEAIQEETAIQVEMQLASYFAEEPSQMLSDTQRPETPVVPQPILEKIENMNTMFNLSDTERPETPLVPQPILEKIENMNTMFNSGNETLSNMPEQTMLRRLLCGQRQTNMVSYGNIPTPEPSPRDDQQMETAFAPQSSIYNHQNLLIGTNFRDPREIRRRESLALECAPQFSPTYDTPATPGSHESNDGIRIYSNEQYTISIPCTTMPISTIETARSHNNNVNQTHASKPSDDTGYYYKDYLHKKRQAHKSKHNDSTSNVPTTDLRIENEARQMSNYNANRYDRPGTSTEQLYQRRDRVAVEAVCFQRRSPHSTMPTENSVAAIESTVPFNLPALPIRERRQSCHERANTNSFGLPTAPNKHRRKSYFERQFKCDECKIRTNSESALQLHKRKYHCEQPHPDIAVCPNCKKRLSTKVYDNHIANVNCCWKPPKKVTEQSTRTHYPPPSPPISGGSYMRHINSSSAHFSTRKELS